MNATLHTQPHHSERDQGMILVMSPELTRHDPASRTRAYSLSNKFGPDRRVLLLNMTKKNDAYFERLKNTLSLFSLSKEWKNQVVLLLQKGATSIVRVGVLLTW